MMGLQHSVMNQQQPTMGKQQPMTGTGAMLAGHSKMTRAPITCIAVQRAEGPAVFALVPIHLFNRVRRESC